VHVGQDTSIERDDVPESCGIDVIPADDRRLAPFEDPDDAPFSPAFRMPLDANHDAVAVHGLREIGGSDINVFPLVA